MQYFSPTHHIYFTFSSQQNGDKTTLSYFNLLFYVRLLSLSIISCLVHISCIPVPCLYSDLESPGNARLKLYLQIALVHFLFHQLISHRQVYSSSLPRFNPCMSICYLLQERQDKLYPRRRNVHPPRPQSPRISRKGHRLLQVQVTLKVWTEPLRDHSMHRPLRVRRTLTPCQSVVVRAVLHSVDDMVYLITRGNMDCIIR